MSHAAVLAAIADLAERMGRLETELQEVKGLLRPRTPDIRPLIGPTEVSTRSPQSPTPLSIPDSDRFLSKVVYYLQREDGAVKIGFSAALEKRIATLEKVHGPLTLLATERGQWMAEQKRHREFHRFRISWEGEWFRPAPELMEHIAILAERKPPKVATPIADGPQSLSPQPVEVKPRKRARATR